MVDDLLEPDGEFRDDDHVGPSGDAPHQRHPPGLASHGLDHHHPVVRSSRGVQPVHRLGDDGNRGVKADAVLGDKEVVVHRLRDADDRHSALRQCGAHR